MQKDNNPYLARLGANISARSQGGVNARNNEATWSGKIAQESELLLLEWLGFFCTTSGSSGNHYIFF